MTFHPAGRPGEMPLLEDPARLSKSRLKSELLAHNVALPPAKSRKEVYVDLHLKHIERRKAAEFSSDEEDRAQDEPVSPPGAFRSQACQLLPRLSFNSCSGRVYLLRIHMNWWGLLSKVSRSGSGSAWSCRGAAPAAEFQVSQLNCKC